MKYHFNADNHDFTCVVVPVNGFGSALLINMATCVLRTSCSSYQDSPRASCCCSAGIFIILCYIGAVSCISTLIEAILSYKMNNLKKKSTKKWNKLYVFKKKMQVK